MITERDITGILETYDIKNGKRILTRNEMERKLIEETLIQCGGVVGGPKRRCPIARNAPNNPSIQNEKIRNPSNYLIAKNIQKTVL